MGFNFSQFVDELGTSKPESENAIVLNQNFAYPDWIDSDLLELFEERAAIMEHDGGLGRNDADREALEAVRAEFEKQKSIFDVADRIVYDSKGGRQSGKTDDRDNQLKRS